MNVELYVKFSKPGFNSMWTVNFQMFKLDLEKESEEPDDITFMKENEELKTLLWKWKRKVKTLA